MVAKRDGSEKNYIFPDSAIWCPNAAEDVVRVSYHFHVNNTYNIYSYLSKTDIEKITIYNSFRTPIDTFLNLFPRSYTSLLLPYHGSKTEMILI